jgi:hypothetical protein
MTNSAAGLLGFARPAQVAGSFSASQSALLPVKYGSNRSPVDAAILPSKPASESLRQISAVLRSCQTMARLGDEPVLRDQIAKVSR